LLREADHLVLDARAVPRATATDLARVHRGAVQVGPDEVVDRFVRLGEVADDLWDGDAVRGEAERPRRVVAGGDGELGEVDGAAVEPARGAGLEPGQLEPAPGEAVAHPLGDAVRGPAAGRL